MEIRSWKNVDEERLNENVTRKMIWGENVMVTRIELSPHTVVPTHDHVSEQLSMVQRGSVTLSFPDGEEVTLNEGDMLVIPSSVPHGVVTGPDGCIVIDIFSPIRQDFIDGTTSYYSQSESGTPEREASSDEAKYRKLHGLLRAAGVKADFEELKSIPLNLLARFVYEKQCVTLGELRQILGLDKKQAKDLLREWKHGDDHSESSYKRRVERLERFPHGLPGFTRR